MLAQDFDAEDDEYDTAKGFYGELELVADEASDEAAAKSHDEGHQADGEKGIDDAVEGVKHRHRGRKPLHHGSHGKHKHGGQ